MTRRTRLALAFAAFIPALGAAPRAHADDQKLYIGALCQENSLGETGAFLRNEAFITRVVNVGNGRLICPITTDNGGGVRTNITVTDTNPGADISCSVSVRNTDGSPAAFQTRFSTGSAGLQVIAPEVTTSFSGRPRSIECILPVNANGITLLHTLLVQELF
jgi:hypothetical protein